MSLWYFFQMTKEKGLRPTSPVHVHVEDDVPVHVHVKQPKKKGKTSSVSIHVFKCTVF